MSILIVLVEISEEEIKQQQYFFHKELLNLFKQPVLIIQPVTILRVKLSNTLNSYLSDLSSGVIELLLIGLVVYFFFLYSFVQKEASL